MINRMQTNRRGHARLRIERLEERAVLSGLWLEIDQLTANDGMADDEFGYDVAIDGDTMVVGAPIHNDAAGAAYVFGWDGTAWVQQAKLTAAGASAGDGLGLDVDIDGDTIIAGGSGDDDVVANSGAAWIFVRENGSWSEQAKLKATDAALLDLFGIKVAVDGDTAIVAAPFDDDDGSASGSAYVFQRSGQTWTEQTKLSASDAAQFDRFGVSVDIDDGTVIVGADANDDAGPSSGSAYVFAEDAGSWNQQVKLTASDAVAEDQFGFSVAINAGTVVVGAFGDDVHAGSAYTFQRANGNWSQQSKLVASDRAVNDWFGHSVAIDDDHIVIGSVMDDDAGPSSGSVYVFVQENGSWTQDGKLTASDAAAADRFGHAVSISDETIVVGTRFQNSVAGQDTGSAYLFATPAAQIDRLIDQVTSLAPDPLNAGQANSLITKLENAAAQIDKGNINPAINQLEAFINQVEAFENASILSTEEATLLLSAANDLRAELLGQL